MNAEQEHIEELVRFEQRLRESPLQPQIDPEHGELQQLKQCVSLLECYRRNRNGGQPYRSDAGSSSGPSRPTQIGRYHLLRELGGGASGIVCLAEDPQIGRQVALKILRPEALFFPEMRTRFLREANAAGQLRHSHIAEVLDVGEHQGVLYIASVYYAGDSLDKQIAERGPLPPRVAAEAVRQIAEAANHAHSHGIIHRDIKPSNVLLEAANPADSVVGKADDLRLRLADFGLAAFLEVDEAACHNDRTRSDLTRTGLAMGTGAYMAPEQAEGRRHDVGIHSDVWAIGMVLHELLTGSVVCPGGNFAAMLRKIEAGQWRPFENSTSRAIPIDLRTIVLKALAPIPADRYQTAKALSDDLQRFLRHEPVTARRQNLARRSVYWLRLNRWPAIIAACVGIFLLTLYINSRRSASLIAKAQRATEQLLFVADMRLAQAAIQASAVEEAERLLQRHRPVRESGHDKDSAANSFVWSHLNRSLQRAEAILNAPDNVFQMAIERIPGSHCFVSGCDDGRLATWLPASSKVCRTFNGHATTVRDVRSSLDGSRIASAADDGKVLLWKVLPDRSIDGVSAARTPSPEPADLMCVANWQAHDERATCVSFSPACSVLASGGSDQFVRVWDVQTQELLFEHNSRDGTVEDVLFVGDRLFALTFHTLQVFRWPDQDFSQSPEMEVLDERIDSQHINYLSLAVTSDQTRLAIGSQQGPIRIMGIDGMQLTLLGTLAGHTGNVYDLEFSDSGDFLVSVSKDASVRRWNCTDGKLLETIRGHDARVYGVALSEEENAIVSCSKDGTVRYWPLLGSATEVQEFGGRVGTSGFDSQKETGIVLEKSLAGANAFELRSGASDRLPFAFIGAASPKLTRSGEYYVLAGAQILTDAREKAVPVQQKLDVDGDGFVERVAFLADLETCCFQRPVEPDGWGLPSIYDSRDRSQWLRVNDSLVSCDGISVSKFNSKGERQRLLSGGTDRELQLLAAASLGDFDELDVAVYRESTHAIEYHRQSSVDASLAQIAELGWLHPGKPLFGCVGDFNSDQVIELALVPQSADRIQICELRDGSLEPAYESPIEAAADGRLLALKTRDDVSTELVYADRDKILVWVWTDGAYRSRVVQNLDELPLAANPAANVLVCNTETHEVAAAIHSFGSVVHATAFSSDGQLLAVATSDLRIRVWDWRRGRLIATLDSIDRVDDALAFDPTGTKLCCGAHDNILVFDLNSRQISHRLSGHDNTIRLLLGLPFASNGTNPDTRDTKAVGALVSLSNDLSVCLWDLGSGVQIARLSGHKSRPITAAVLDSEQLLATGGESGEVILWDLKTLQPILFLDARCRLVWIGFKGNHELVAVGNTDQNGQAVTRVLRWKS